MESSIHCLPKVQPARFPLITEGEHISKGCERTAWTSPKVQTNFKYGVAELTCGTDAATSSVSQSVRLQGMNLKNECIKLSTAIFWSSKCILI